MSLDPSIPRCQHIKLNGVRCGSPALRRRTLCFFHHRAQKYAQQCALEGTQRLLFPLLEDGNAVQFSVMQVLRAFADDRLDSKKAALLLYGLQIASCNLRRVDSRPYWRDVVTDLSPAGLAAPPSLPSPDDGRQELHQARLTALNALKEMAARVG